MFYRHQFSRTKRPKCQKSLTPPPQLLFNSLKGSVTREMTASELKFALLVENTLNFLPDPSMRQMVVESLSILSLLANMQTTSIIDWIIDVDEIVKRAQQMFLEDQRAENLPSSKDGQFSNVIFF